MQNVKEIANCYGCGVCATVCAKRAITIDLNKSGFYTPVLDTSLCTNCGLCADVCSYMHEELSQSNNIMKGYGAWSKNQNIRLRCSSGGVGFELGKYLLENGYEVCAVKYDSINQRAEHYIATNEEELMLSIGSKYIQSYTVEAFRKIKKNKKYLVTGTPCQIDSFRRYIRKFKIEDNFILMDFFCHSVPSMLAWNKYLQIVEKEIGPIVYASWRNKFTGWHDSWAMAMDGVSSTSRVEDLYKIYTPEPSHQYISRWSKGDIFYRLFLGDYCCNPACEKKCKYKYDRSSADIRIGDFWGKTYASDEDGVSAVVAFTEKGNDILKELNCTLVEHPFEVVAEGQMKKNVGRHFLSDIVSSWLSSSNLNLFVIKGVFLVDSLCRLPKRIKRKLFKKL